MKDWIKKNRLLILGWGITLAFFAYFVIIQSTFVFEGDMLTQNVRFYAQSWNRIREGSMPFWNWNNFLGANYFGGMTYYGLFSPFFWLMMAVPKIDWIIPMILVTNCLKSMLCITFSYLWLQRSFKSNKGAFLGAIVITFSGFIMTNYNNSVMLDSICFMPLALYFTEIFLENKKFLGLALTIGLIGICNYYFLYLFLPFLCLFALMRYLSLNRFQWKACFITAMQYLAIVLLGVGMSCFVLIPSFLMLQSNPRTSAFPSILSMISKEDWYRFFTAFINPINDWRENNNYFISTLVDEGIGYSGGMALYSFMITPLCICLMISLKNAAKKLWLIGLYALYLVFVAMPFFYVLFNQNFESRWMFNLIFLNAYCTAYVFSMRNTLQRKKIILSTVFILGSILGCLLITRNFNLTSPVGWSIIKRNSIFVSCFLLFYSGALLIKKQKLSSLVLSITVIVELVFCGYNLFYNYSYSLAPIKDPNLSVSNLMKDEAIEWIKANDADFYRISLDDIGHLKENDASLKDYHGFTGYTSLYNFNQQAFTTNRFKLNYNWFFSNQNSKWMLKNLLANKYYIADAQNTKIPFGYEEIKTVGNNKIYVNTYPITFGYGVDSVISQSQFNNYSTALQDRILLHSVVLDKDIADQPTNFYLENVVEEGNKEIHVDVSNLTDGYLIVDFDGFTTVGYTFYDENNEIIDYDFITKDLGYSVIAKPENAVLLIIVTNQGADVYYDDMTWFSSWYSQLADEMIYNVQYSANEISGTITLKESKWVVTSIPYDKGWTLKVNGKATDYEKVNNGFIGFQCSEGTYELNLAYFPPGFTVGMVITFLSLTAIFGLSLRKKLSKMKVR